MFSSHRLAEALITSQRPRVSALSDVAHRDARAPRPAPTHLRTRPGDPALTSTSRRAQGQLPARDVRSSLCSLRHAGGCYEQYEWLQMHRRDVFLREQSGVSHLEGHQWPQNTHIPRRLACRTCVESASSLSRVSSPLSCAAPPAPRSGASRQRAAHVFAACRPRRAASAGCYRAGS